MTQQTAAAAEVKTWEVGKTYLCRGLRAGHKRCARVLAIDLRGPQPIAAAFIEDDETETVAQFRPDGGYMLTGTASLDLTTELAP